MEKNILLGSWFFKYTPKSIDDIVFSNPTDKRLVKSWIEEESIDGNVLFSGPPGNGKTALAEIIIKNNIKAQNDLYRMKTRSVQEVDELKTWVTKRPVRSKQKIVYIEEIDKISMASMNTLKDQIMEKNQNHCVFIACPNYPKKLDNGILTRFTHRDINFNPKNIQGMVDRIKFILDSEGVEYDNKIKEFVEKNYSKGLRDLINIVQTNSKRGNGKINFEEIFIESPLEDAVITSTISIIKESMETTPQKRRQISRTPLNTSISEEYQIITKTILNNDNIDYDKIFEELWGAFISFIPVQTIIGKYHDDLDRKRFKHIHFLAMLYEVLTCIEEVA